MAVHNLGYRSWTGELAAPYSRFVVITETGVRRAWNSTWLRRMLVMAWMPALYVGLGIFLLEQGLADPQRMEFVRPFVQGMTQASMFGPVSRDVTPDDPERYRHLVWSWLMQFYFRYPQGVLMVLMIGIIAPPLISQDVRSRAFLLYFSRPINRWEYILGKASTIWAYLLLITAVPALLLYLLGVLLSPGLGVVFSTWDVPVRILISSAVLMIPTASLGLCLSAMTQESRNAGFAWFAIWILGTFTYSALGSAEMFGSPQQMNSAQYEQMLAAQMGIELEPPPISKWTYFSLYETLGVVQAWIFGFETFSRALPSICLLTILTVVATAVLFRKVSAPMRA